VIVGAPHYDAGELNEGAAFLFLGSSAGIASGNPATAAARLESNQQDAKLGSCVASAGDVNGDGYADVIVGAYRYDAGQVDEGAAFLFLGSAAGIAGGDPATAAALLQANQNASFFGSSVASAGDVNADGYADVIVGALAYDAGQGHGEGAAFVFVGSAAGVANGDPATASAQLESNQAYAELGSSVASAGDVNGDGYADVIVGAWQYDAGQVDEGAAFVFLGSAAGIANGNPVTASARLESNQQTPKPQLGFSVASAGDVNGDGYADVIAGANLFDAGDGDEGAAFLFLGNGDGSGRPVLVRQLRGDGSGTPVQPFGASFAGGGFEVRARGTHPFGRGRVKLEVESCGPGVAFGHASCAKQSSASWTDVTASSAGVTLALAVGGQPQDQLRHWRARLLRAPFQVTQLGITPPAKPEHGPWRRLEARAGASDIRALLDLDPDEDDDGVLDVYETHTGIFFSLTNTGTDPLDPDSDDDGLLDGAELAFGTNPNDPDHDDDGACDGPATGGGACTAGPDNCPFLANPAQTNSDTLPAGNACQCGDVNDDGVVNAGDVARAGENLIGRTLGGTFVAARCNVIGPSDGGASDCDVADLAVLQRFANGTPVTVPNACQAYGSP